MKTLGETIGVKKVSGDVGIEIELVGVNLPNYEVLEDIDPLWRRDEDGSLRGPETGEYVLRRPVPIKEVEQKLSNLQKAFDKCKTTILPSVTAGTHVHVNVQSFTSKQLITFICAYLILEELIVDWCSPERRGNHFCLRAKDAEYLPLLISDAVSNNNYGFFDTEAIRYSSINLMSLFKYGSVEFRSLEGTSDFNKINTWANLLHTLKVNSLNFSSPVDLFNKVSAQDFSFFVQSLLGEYSALIKVGDWKKKVREGILISQDIAFARDWNSKDFNIFRIKGAFNFD